MNSGPLVFLGLFFALVSSWCGFILAPQFSLGNQQPAVIEEFTGKTYPPVRPGLARQGKEIYQANGCAYCHTQQVRGGPEDIDRWGKRRSVAADYLYDIPVLLGAQRLGPDLTNIGLRQTSGKWLLLHLYNPQIVAKGSVMPPYRSFFEKHKINGKASTDSLRLLGEFAPEKGYEIVAGSQAKALVAYLLSLHSEVALFESPLPAPSTNTLSTTVTNAPSATATNPPPASSPPANPK